MTNYVRKTTAGGEGLLVLAAAMEGVDTDVTIPAMERAGQRQLVASAVMPTETGDRAAYEALGFVFGELVEGDDLFTHCTLPDGWTKQSSDHDMWSYVVDQFGRRRIAVFYKAAFYDRRAFCRLEKPASYLNSALYGKTTPVLDDEWLTVEVATAELETIAKAADEAAVQSREFAKTRDNDTYWLESATEHDAEAAAARAMSAQIAGAK